MTTTDSQATDGPTEARDATAGDFSRPPCSADFTFRIPATDGGLPFDFIDRKNDDYDCACVYRGDDDLGTGSRLLKAWDNYLYTVPQGAPVNDDDLAQMWAAYDEWIDSPNDQDEKSPPVKP